MRSNSRAFKPPFVEDAIEKPGIASRRRDCVAAQFRDSRFNDSTVNFHPNAQIHHR
jgi:hypothetical protein